jgi:hypothetical protein
VKNLAVGEQKSLSLDEIIVKMATETPQPQRLGGGEMEGLERQRAAFLSVSLSLPLCSLCGCGVSVAD